MLLKNSKKISVCETKGHLPYQQASDVLTQTYFDILWASSLMAETLNCSIKGVDGVSRLKGYPRGFIIFAYGIYGKAASFSRGIRLILFPSETSLLQVVDLKLCRSKQTVNFSEVLPFCFSKCCRHLNISHCSMWQESRAEDQLGVLANSACSWGQRKWE